MTRPHWCNCFVKLFPNWTRPAVGNWFFCAKPIRCPYLDANGQGWEQLFSTHCEQAHGINKEAGGGVLFNLEKEHVTSGFFFLCMSGTSPRTDRFYLQVTHDMQLQVPICLCPQFWSFATASPFLQLAFSADKMFFCEKIDGKNRGKAAEGKKREKRGAGWINQCVCLPAGDPLAGASSLQQQKKERSSRLLTRAISLFAIDGKFNKFTWWELFNFLFGTLIPHTSRAAFWMRCCLDALTFFRATAVFVGTHPYLVETLCFWHALQCPSFGQRILLRALLQMYVCIRSGERDYNSPSNLGRKWGDASESNGSCMRRAEWYWEKVGHHCD